MRWSEMKILGLSTEEAQVVSLKADRLEESYRPDGRHEYVPLTPAYAGRELYGRKVLAKLGIDYAELMGGRPRRGPVGHRCSNEPKRPVSAGRPPGLATRR
ncbi:MAG: hypothetical protein KatS3mg051_1203 [Anaerolineae bacterium]|nr:MAG: hypothetical protein KatS3mg051_1203 [Anaerolineae bacterium]